MDGILRRRKSIFSIAAYYLGMEICELHNQMIACTRQSLVFRHQHMKHVVDVRWNTNKYKASSDCLKGKHANSGSAQKGSLVLFQDAKPRTPGRQVLRWPSLAGFE